MTEIQQPPKRNIPYSGLKRRLARLMEWAGVPLLLFCRRPAEPVRKILLIEPFMLGDASFLSVMLDPLKARFPEAEIHLFVQPKCAVLYAEERRVAKIHAYHLPWIQQRGERVHRWRHFFRAVAALRREKIDMAIDVRGEIRSQLLMTMAGIPRRVGFINYLCSNMVIKGRLLTDNAGMMPLQHRIHTCLDLCELVGCVVDRGAWMPYAADKQVSSPQRILVHTGAGGFLRAWPTDRWAALLARIHDRCSADVVLAGTAAETAQNRTIAEASGFMPKIKTTVKIEELIAEIDASDLLICLDSAPLHLAVLRHKPVLALFGPGPARLYQPISPGSRLIHHQEQFECAPCLQNECVQELQAACMQSIAVDEVFSAFCGMVED